MTKLKCSLPELAEKYVTPKLLAPFLISTTVMRSRTIGIGGFPWLPFFSHHVSFIGERFND